LKTKRIGISKPARPKPERSEWGTLTKREVEILREFLNRFIDICPDADNKIDPADKKRIAAVRKILQVR
jgi:hypothetical protein